MSELIKKPTRSVLAYLHLLKAKSVVSVLEWLVIFATIWFIQHSEKRSNKVTIPLYIKNELAGTVIFEGWVRGGTPVTLVRWQTNNVFDYTPTLVTSSVYQIFVRER